jgi:hypothetical protein
MLNNGEEVRLVWIARFISAICNHRHSTRPLFSAISIDMQERQFQEDVLPTDGLILALSAAKSDTKRFCDVTRHIRAPLAAFDNKHALLPHTAFSICVQTVCNSGYAKSSL